MQRIWKHIPVVGLLAGLAAAVPQAAAQETRTRDTSTAAQDTATDVQNPPGYRGMERPVDVFPPDSGADTMRAGRVEDRATGTYDDSTWQDTTGGTQNPPGYRGMERPVGQDTSATGKTGTQDRLKPTDTTGTSADAGADSGAAADRTDSAAVQPGSTEPVTPDQADDRLQPTDSIGADTSGGSQNP